MSTAKLIASPAFTGTSFLSTATPVRTRDVLATAREDNQDRDAFVVDEVALFPDRDERGLSGLEPAAISFGLEARFAGQDDVDLVGCVSHQRIGRGRDVDKHAYFEVW